jgi:hypothetical protein
MALMLSKTYAAFKAAGVPEPDAQAAAEEIASYDRDLPILKWMVGGIYALLTIIGAPSLWLLLKLAGKAGVL